MSFFDDLLARGRGDAELPQPLIRPAAALRIAVESAPAETVEEQAREGSGSPLEPAQRILRAPDSASRPMPATPRAPPARERPLESRAATVETTIEVVSPVVRVPARPASAHSTERIESTETIVQRTHEDRVLEVRTEHTHEVERLVMHRQIEVHQREPVTHTHATILEPVEVRTMHTRAAEVPFVEPRVTIEQVAPIRSEAPRINVSIGRVVVKSAPSEARPSKEKSRPGSAMTLDEYLSRRGGS